MNEHTKAPHDFDALAGLVRTSFPDIRCLRCGNEDFYLTDRAATLLFPGYDQDDREHFPGHQLVTLGCTRCGHLEHHLKSVLDRAPKPILGTR